MPSRWEVSSAYSAFDFVAYYKAYMVESVQAKGATPAEVAKAVEQAAEFEKMYRNPMYRVPMVFVEMFPVGVLISLISAAILRNSRVLPARA